MFFPTFSLGPVYEFVCISFRTDNLYCLGQFDHGGQDGNAAQSRIRDEMSENGHTLKTKLSSWFRTIKALAILRCLYGSEMVLLGVFIRKCETSATNISQENGHSILMITCQIVAYN